MVLQQFVQTYTHMLFFKWCMCILDLKLDLFWLRADGFVDMIDLRADPLSDVVKTLNG